MIYLLNNITEREIVVAVVSSRCFQGTECFGPSSSSSNRMFAVGECQRSPRRVAIDLPPAPVNVG